MGCGEPNSIVGEWRAAPFPRWHGNMDEADGCTTIETLYIPTHPKQNDPFLCLDYWPFSSSEIHQLQRVEREVLLRAGLREGVRQRHASAGR